MLSTSSTSVIPQATQAFRDGAAGRSRRDRRVLDGRDQAAAGLRVELCSGGLQKREIPLALVELSVSTRGGPAVQRWSRPPAAALRGAVPGPVLGDPQHTPEHPTH
jgi:hypothetical protein